MNHLRRVDSDTDNAGQDPREWGRLGDWLSGCSRRRCLAGRQGFEPRYRGPESGDWLAVRAGPLCFVRVWGVTASVRSFRFCFVTHKVSHCVSESMGIGCPKQCLHQEMYHSRFSMTRSATVLLPRTLPAGVAGRSRRPLHAIAGLSSELRRPESLTRSLTSSSLSCSVVFSSRTAASCIGSTLTPQRALAPFVIASRRLRVRGASGISRRSVQCGSVARPPPAGTRKRASTAAGTPSPRNSLSINIDRRRAERQTPHRAVGHAHLPEDNGRIYT
jgi:hypothetical protein